MNKTASILGSTGSIGTQSLEVCEKHGFDVIALAAHSSVELLERQARKFKPEYVCIYKEECLPKLKKRLADTGIEVLLTLTAIKAGKDIALANKETLVAGGKLVMELAKEKGVKIYPVDSEHSAIFQCLQGNKRSQLSKIILTASGGPFRGKTV